MTRLGLALAFCALLMAAVVPQPAAARGIFCTTNYIPVCAVNKAGVRSTYSNACWARVAGARILAPGECLGPICFFLIVDPVCAIDPTTGKQKTYSNLCLAETNNATLVHKGACRGG